MKVGVDPRPGSDPEPGRGRGRRWSWVQGAPGAPRKLRRGSGKKLLKFVVRFLH